MGCGSGQPLVCMSGRCRDLTGIAVDYTTFGYLDEQQWDGFCHTSGHDVTAWAGFETLRGARELQKVAVAFQLADK
jgi:hypothetical protein